MTETPLVSVLMTAFNQEKHIAEAIESVLASNYSNFELIITDDQSKDETVEIVNHFSKSDERVKLFINDKNLGDYPNRNKASTYARGKYIKFLDADDIIYHYGLHVMVEYMERFPEAGFGLASLVSSAKPFPILLSPKEIYLENFNEYSHFDRAPGSSIIRLDAFKRVGGFSGKRMIGDYEFWFKIARYYSMVKFPFDLYWSRVHPNQESQTDYARKNYSILRRTVLEEALLNPDCPLSAEEIRQVRIQNRRIERKDVFLNYLSKINKVIRKKNKVGLNN